MVLEPAIAGVGYVIGFSLIVYLYSIKRFHNTRTKQKRTGNIMLETTKHNKFFLNSFHCKIIYIWLELQTKVSDMNTLVDS